MELPGEGLYAQARTRALRLITREEILKRALRDTTSLLRKHLPWEVGLTLAFIIAGAIVGDSILKGIAAGAIALGIWASCWLVANLWKARRRIEHELPLILTNSPIELDPNRVYVGPTLLEIGHKATHELNSHELGRFKEELVGRYMQLVGPVSDIGSNPPSVSLRMWNPGKMRFAWSVRCIFKDKYQDQVIQLPKYCIVTVDGKVSSIKKIGIQLTDCKLLRQEFELCG